MEAILTRRSIDLIFDTMRDTHSRDYHNASSIIFQLSYRLHHEWDGEREEKRREDLQNLHNYVASCFNCFIYAVKDIRKEEEVDEEIDEIYR